MRAILSARWSPAERHYIEAHHQRVHAWIAHPFGEDGRALKFAVKAALRLRDAGSGSIAAKYAKRALCSRLALTR